MSKTIRPGWNTYFMNIARCTAERSSCERLQVGCVLVQYKDKRIISQGYNGFLAGCPHESVVRDGHEQATIHAEMNAVAHCAKSGVSCDGATAYITHYPCLNCMRLLCSAGIKGVVFADEYKVDPLVAHFAQQAGVSIEQEA